MYFLFITYSIKIVVYGVIIGYIKYEYLIFTEH